MSFFGGLHLGQVDCPHRCPDNHLAVAGLRDLFATKLNTVYQRSEAKDYLDIHALIKTGLSLTMGLSCARAVYGAGFNPMLPLKALTYFLDGDLPSLPSKVRRDLVGRRSAASPRFRRLH